MFFNHKEIEKKVHDIWQENKIPEKIVKFDEDKEKFYLLDGPPYVNDTAHVGHVKTTTFKDIWGKFKFMQGYSVWFQPGFDCGGLPIENAVEKRLGIQSKSEIEKIGVKNFINECRKLAKGNEPVWLDLYRKLGAWRGWLRPYLTIDNSFRESAWWTVKTLYDKGMLVEGNRPGFWCIRCETVLSGYEVTDSYKDLEDHSIFVKFKLENNEFLLAWTTTPWTLPANVALCVHPDEVYVKAEVNYEVIIIAEKRLGVLDDIGIKYRILEKIKGKDLAGIKYRPLLDIPLQKKLSEDENSHQVVLSIPIMKKRVASKVQIKKVVEDQEEFGHVVTMDAGSGIVHIAPGHGEIDNRLGKHYSLQEPSPVNEKGILTQEAGIFASIRVKQANEKIIDYLKNEGLLLHDGKIVHSYPLCWRCKTPLIYRMSRQWFLKIDTIRDIMIKEAKKVDWMPSFASGRFENLLHEAPDWAVTRQRYWGIPLPVWKCEKCESKKVIGSLDELKKEAEENYSELEISKEIVDKIYLKCECGASMKREPDIMDVWFDSSITPWASLGYPFQNKKLFEKLWPVDLIDESQDQIRGWFYYLMFSSAAVFGQGPYKKVSMNGWVLDEKGDKMSKSVGNVVWAKDGIEQLGSDLLRLYYCYETPPWETQKFSLMQARELGRQLNMFFNAYNYFKTYSRIETNKYSLSIEDRWILSRLNSLIKNATENLENFNFHFVGREIMNFIVNDFSRTYIKIIRDRSDKSVDYTLTKIFDSLLKVMAPLAPFITEYLFHEMYGDSVHLQSWPDYEEKMIDQDLENDMKVLDEIVTMSNVVRKNNNIKLRWPLSLIKVDAGIKNKDLAKTIAVLANVKEVEFSKLKKEGDIGIELDTTFIKEDALLRELLREIQKKRKELGMNVSQKIILYLDSEMMKQFKDEITEKVNASEIIFEDIKNGEELGRIDLEDVIKFKFKVM